jgi:hypothetical protein
MTETPINDHIKSYMEPLIKSSERIGSARALLMIAQWLKDELDANQHQANQRPAIHHGRHRQDTHRHTARQGKPWLIGTKATHGDWPEKQLRKCSTQSAPCAAKTSRVVTGQ